MRHAQTYAHVGLAFGREKLHTAAIRRYLCARQYAQVGIGVGTVNVVCELAVQSEMRNKTIVEARHHRTVLEEVGLMACRTVHKVEFERCIACVEFVAEGYVRNEFARHILNHICRIERVEPSVVASPVQMIGEHVAVGRRIEEALGHLTAETALAVGGGIGSAGTKLERSDVVPEFRRDVYVDRAAVVLVSAHKSRLLSGSHVPVVVQLIVEIYPVGAVKPVVLVLLLIDALSP